MRLWQRRAPLALALFLIGAASGPSPATFPAIVFVSRQPLRDGAGGAVPGLGPGQRASVCGGRLLVREPGGRIRALLPDGACYDVSDPSVSPGGARVAFAAVAAPDSAWRIWVVGLDGRGLAAVTRSDRAPLPAAFSGERFARYDDLDPCWIGERTLVFASTRYPQRAQYADLPVTNLFRVEIDGGAPFRLTAERNGAEEPSFDPARGRVLFARWWFNRWRASDQTPLGITAQPGAAIAADTANLWHAMAISPDGTGLALAAGDFESRLTTMAYQPVALSDGTVLGVVAANTGLAPWPGRLGLQAFPRGFGRARRVAGASIETAEGYGSARGLAAPAAVSPAPLPDGRIVFAFDPGARGDFGLYVSGADGSGLTRLVDLPGTLELDPAPVVRWRPRRPVPPLVETRAAFPARTPGELNERAGRFRFQSLGVFAPRPRGVAGGDPPPFTRAARIRFFATLARPGAAGGDTAVLLREAPVGADGGVDEAGLPADTPLFEQLVDGGGRVLRSAHAPAHVAGTNAGRAGETVRCIGCHAGHSSQLARFPRSPATPRR